MAPGGPEVVTGAERLAWIQPAPNAAELATLRFAVYLDGVRSELAGAGCQAIPTPRVFQCSAPLPPMSTGAHAIELAAFIIQDGVLESPRSAPLQVSKTTGSTAVPEPGPASSPASLAVRTTDGVQMRLDWIAEGLTRPVDLAFTPDSRLLVAEESGVVRVITPDGRLLAEPELSLRSDAGETRLIALAVDPRFVYTLYSTSSPGEGAVVRLARFEEASNALVGQVVLLDVPAANRGAAATIRVAADGTLFAAFDDGGDEQQASDLASPNGKVLRLNSDGTTPDNQAGFTPMYASPFRSPRGLAWQPGSNLLWMADQVSEGSATIGAIGAIPGPWARGETLASYMLPRGTRPSSIAFYRDDLMPALRNNLFIASDEGRHLLRLQFDPAEPTRVIGTERLLQNAIGGIRAIAPGPDGRIYLATAGAIAALAAADR